MSLELLGADVVGEFDVASTQHDLDRIRPVSVSQAKVLLKYGQQVIDQAIKTAGAMHAPSPWGLIIPLANLKNAGVPQQDAKRSEVYWKLKWHEDALARLSTPGAAYGAGEDLKKWLQAAFIEFNSVEEGTEYTQANWDALLEDLKNNAIAVTEQAGRTIENAGDTVGWFSRNWKIVLGLGAGVAVLGVGGIYIVPLVLRRRLRMF